MVYKASYSLCSIEYTYFQFTVCSLPGEDLGREEGRGAGITCFEIGKYTVKMVLTFFLSRHI